MQKQLESPISQQDVKSLATMTGPCVTLFFPTQAGSNVSWQDETRLKQAAHEAEGKLLQSGLDRRSTDELLAPIRSLTSEDWNVAHGSVVILRSPEIFQHFQVEDELSESVFVGDRFHLLPILNAVAKLRQEFYLLALSQKHVRLLHCTSSSSEEVPWPVSEPQSLEEWLNVRSPNSPAEQSATRDSSAGPAGAFTSTADSDKHPQHLSNFFHHVNKAVVEALHHSPFPLVLAAVEYEQTIYRQANTYPHLVETAVTGSPDGLKGGELHKRALEAVQPYFSHSLERAASMWEKFGGSDRVATDLKTIMVAAYESRVAELFVAKGSQSLGKFDPTTLTIALHQAPGEDLLNLAAMQTLAMGGEVFVVDSNKVPGGGPIAAIFRY